VLCPGQRQVTEVQLFTRPDDSQQGWGESRVEASQDAQGEVRGCALRARPPRGQQRSLFQFPHWGAEKGRMARIVVRYVI